MRTICTRYLIIKQLRPSQIDREQLIREGGNKQASMCSQLRKATHMQRLMNGNEINLLVGLQGERIGKIISRHTKQTWIWWGTQRQLSHSSYLNEVKEQRWSFGLAPLLIYRICDERIGSKIISMSKKTETLRACYSSDIGLLIRRTEHCVCKFSLLQ